MPNKNETVKWWQLEQFAEDSKEYTQKKIDEAEPEIRHYKTWAEYESDKDNVPAEALFIVDEDNPENKIPDHNLLEGREEKNAHPYTAIEGLQAELDKKTDVAKTQTLESRMNQFAKLPSGSTAGDAELADIRVGADGKTYDQAGEAVRGQITSLKETIKEISVESKNIFDLNKLAWESATAGVIHDNKSENSFTVKNDRVSAYSSVYCPIAFKPNTRYTLSFDVVVNKGYALIGKKVSTDGGQTYPSQISSIKGIGSASGHYSVSIDTTSDVYYRLMFFGTWSTASDCDVTFSNVQIEESNKETSYYPHLIAFDREARELVEETKYVNAFNLIKREMLRPRLLELNGVKFAIDSEGYITMNGIATANFSWAIIASSTAYSIELDSEYYTLSGCNNNGKGYSTYVSIRKDGTTHALECYDRPVSYRYGKGNAELYMGITIQKDTVLNNDKVCFMLERGRIVHDYIDPIIQPVNLSKAISSSLAYTPVNMIPPMQPRTTNGIQVKTRSDGTVILNGTATKTTSLAIVARASGSTIKRGRYYTISGCENGSPSSYYIYMTIQSVTSLSQYNEPLTFYLDGNDEATYWFGIQVLEGTTLNNVEFKPMLEAGLYHNEYVSPYEVTESTNTVPVLTGDAIAISEGARLSRTEWHPVADVLNFEKGETYNGIPYHANLHLDGRDVFVNRTLETFYSAVKNPASILYNGKYDDYDETGELAYGAMCSSFTHWIYGQKIVRWTEELYNGYLETYEYNGAESVAVGDVMVEYNGIRGHVMSICGIDVDANTGTTMYFRIIDETIPTIRQRRLDVPTFEKLLETYKLGRYPSEKIVTVKPLRYSTDIITEYGNNTYFKNGEDIWCYISTENKAVTIKNLKTGSERTVTPTLSKTVNNVVVYNISAYLSDNAEYEVSTDPSITNRCKILRINTGNASNNRGVVSINGNSENAVPEWAYVYSGSGERIGNVVFNGNNADVSELVLGITSFYLKIYYKTKYGYAVTDTDTFII